ncbi:thioredoxin family protein [Candidatus Marinamargulisbacteria bacterium SCGC AG-410-N11]|nr:thioredoxin family protein [Candidatus Marinamargulisbacteria bacterium SCGC AG-410-N11]
MVLLESKQLTIGSKMPDFKLNTPNNESYSLTTAKGEQGLLIVFTCNHCPYAIAIWERLIELSHWAKKERVNTVAINPNINPNYPDDSPTAMAKKISEWKIPFPYLIDNTQNVAQQYQAQCTPDLYLLNKNSELYYHGRLDDNWQNPDKVQKEELKDAIQDMISNKLPPKNQNPSMGCSIKWL